MMMFTHLSSVLWLSSCTCWISLLFLLLAVAPCRKLITSSLPLLAALLCTCTTIRMLLALLLAACCVAHSLLAACLHPACIAPSAHASSTTMREGSPRAPALAWLSARSRRHTRLTRAVALSASAAALLLQGSGCRMMTVSAASAATRSRSRALAGRPERQKMCSLVC